MKHLKHFDSFDPDLALKLNKFVHDEFENIAPVPHDIGVTLALIVAKHQLEQKK